ncbi:NUDIX domain-containing protein [Streptomyces sp. NPDC006670]|uniref:NUDIX hydrolase n=1 Tax=Streptomyces sp. NPDC006670 TaxID=3154476 RepID=UPI003405978F
MTNTCTPPRACVKTTATSYAGFYFTDTIDRLLPFRSVLSVETWQWPGGNMDAGKTRWECALRECFGETQMAFAGS